MEINSLDLWPLVTKWSLGPSDLGALEQQEDQACWEEGEMGHDRSYYQTPLVLEISDAQIIFQACPGK